MYAASSAITSATALSLPFVSNRMQRIAICFLLLAALFTGCRASRSDVREAIERQMTEFPESTLQDIYKSFYQARFGTGHMITDTAAMRAYLLYELEVAAADTFPSPYYEPVGANGAFVRVYLRNVIEGRLTAEQLLDAFVRSAHPAQPATPDQSATSLPATPAQSWLDEWSAIVQTLREMGWAIDEDEYALLTQAAQADRAVHHSPSYRNAYHPHYRLVRSDIWQEL